MSNLEDIVARVKTYGSINKAWRKSGIKRSTFQNRYKEAVEKGLAPKRVVNKNHDLLKQLPPPVSGRVRARQTPKIGGTGRKEVFILSCAQNNTHLHPALWDNLQALAAHDKGRIIVARTVYSRFAMSSDMDKKLIIDRPNSDISREYKWADELHEHFLDERAEIAPGLVWCGELNISPTSSVPLSGFEGYTGRLSSVIPHPRVAMRSVASHAAEATKFLYTTGTVTQRNYIQRKAGMLADFHHGYGALLVEVAADGTWFTRQLNADNAGTIWDLDRRVKDGKVTTGHRLKAINWGDLHEAYRDEVNYALAWGPGGILDTLKPEYQFMHDLIDFRTRNPHNIRQQNYLQAFVEFTKGHKNVEREMLNAASFLNTTLRPDCETVVVNSNHDNWFVGWLENTGDFRKDPENAVYFLRAASYLWSQTAQDGKAPNMTEWAMRDGIRDTGPLLARDAYVQFLDEDEPFIICPEAHGGIECGMHGHQGANGSRGTPAGLSKMGRKANIGDKHSAGIYDGLYVAGLMGSQDQGYNSGPGSWSATNIFTYETGKRAMSTIYNGRWKA